ncbi:hypothetical protein [Roseobacter sp.]|uniref:hypothetical protein n=1 Tax=Roseobacter sp. TaxID=1907202 RepID=UPI00385B5B4A
MVGSRLNRSLFHLPRDHIFECPICGRPHVHDDPRRACPAIEIASELITHGEDWYEVPNDTLFRMGEDYRLDMEPFLHKA